MSTYFAQNSPKITPISLLDTPYLSVLSQIPDPPKRLYCRGTLPSSRQRTAAIVGTRKPTAYGRAVTEELAGKLARRNVVIISGLALGVDAIAHKSALEAGGTTIAIQANGLHTINPRTNRQLGESIIGQGGAILSEYEAGVEAMKHHFLARNRLVSGIADIIIITEAAARSGALNTAAHALAQGKEVFAVPGNITSPMSAGCNRLIAQGATPLVDIDQLIDEFLPAEVTDRQVVLPLGSTELESYIIMALGKGISDGETIFSQCRATAADFNTAMTMLEINGTIKPLGGNQWALR